MNNLVVDAALRPVWYSRPIVCHTPQVRTPVFKKEDAGWYQNLRRIHESRSPRRSHPSPASLSQLCLPLLWAGGAFS
jgi:hypothetical protein